MKTSHTPGPWRIDPEIDHAITTQSGLRIAEVATYGAGLVSISEIAPWHHHEANARLIAAAPELLEIARRALEYAPNEIEANKCRAAIAKATKA